MEFTRRTFFGITAAAAALPLLAQNRQAIQHRVTEFMLPSGKAYPDPLAVEVDVEFTGPSGTNHRMPAFWAGDNVWRVRYAPPVPGAYRCRSVCSDSSNRDLHGVESLLQVSPYTGENPLYQHGPLQVSANKRYLQHADGSPFFWLGDTWWMALAERLRWPEDFAWLAADRKRKGFNVVQFVAGLYPDMDSFDPRGRGDGGFPWTEGYGTINPAWWDMADLRVQHLVETGLVPCILGCWGYYLYRMGAGDPNRVNPEASMAKMRQHWRTIVARWGAYPVVWALAGEGSMPWYLSETKDADRARLVKGWTELGRYVRSIDPYKRIVTVHPSRNARESVDDLSTIDFDMLQTGHGDRKSLPNTIRSVVASYAAQPQMPVVNGEVTYEGILGQAPHEIQRLMFWASILNGACGFTYGANGIWQVNLPGKPYGPSPHGNAWGNTPWKEAAQMPGSAHLGVCAELLRQYEWWRFEPHPEWMDPRPSDENFEQPYAAGIPGKLRFAYIPTRFNPPAMVGLEAGNWEAMLVNPSTGERHRYGQIPVQGGRWQLPNAPEVRDWVVVAERKG